MSKKLKENPDVASSGLLGEWVNISDQLPPYNEPVIVFQPNWKGQHVTLAEFICTDSSGHKFCFDPQSSQYDRRDNRYSVTHWMRLPNPPNSEVRHAEPDGTNMKQEGNSALS